MLRLLFHKDLVIL